MSYRVLKTNVLASVLALSVMSVGCSPTAPGPPDPPPPPPPPPVEVNYTISGAVTEMTDGGPMPVEGVRVTVSSSNQVAMTDANGLYSIPGIKATDGFVSAIKEGYTTATTVFKATADTRLDIRVARIVTYTLSGMAYEQTPAGRVPIGGIVLYCDGCGSPVGHTYVTTDADGLYNFDWVQSGTTYLQVVGKEGYVYVGPASTALGVPVTTLGHTRFDIEFRR